MAEFTELNKNLAKHRALAHIVPALDLFSEHNTTYAVYEYFDCVSFVEHLRENAGELPWTTVSAMFPSLFNTLGMLHHAGIIHRGISPSTLYYTARGDLKLQNFCVSSIRTANTELEAELFDGYAAPEQYLPNEKQGTWTDVYGVCATLYRILVGSMPTDARSRLDNDNLRAPFELNGNIPRNVSDAIMNGMKLDGRERIQTVQELVSKLFDANPKLAAAPVINAPPLERTSTIVIPSQSKLDSDMFYEQEEYPPRRRRSDYDGSRSRSRRDYDNEYDSYEKGHNNRAAQKEESTERIKTAVIVGVLLLAILMILMAVATPFFQGNKPPVQTTHGSGTTTGNATESETGGATQTTGDSIMPNLIGGDFELRKITHANWFSLTAEHEYNEDYPLGQIFWQEIPDGERFSSGSTIKVKVSRGSRFVKIPAFAGKRVEAYTAELAALGITHRAQSEVNQDRQNFFVTRIAKQGGGATETFDVMSNDVLVVYYADNPEVTTAVTTEPPTDDVTEAPTEALTDED